MICCHLLCRGQKCQDIFLILRHDRDLGDIRAQLLHLAESADDIILIGGLEEIMVGSYDLHAGGMGARDNVFNDFIACKCFHVDHINKPGRRCLFIQFRVSIRLNGLLSAFLGCTECEKDGLIAKGRTEIFQDILYLCEIKNAVEPVDPPLHDIISDTCERSRCREDLFFCLGYDGNDDLGNAFTDLDAAYFYSFAHGNTSNY